jgi:hypothetical protein
MEEGRWKMEENTIKEKWKGLTCQITKEEKCYE